jgi:hypothetical protein
MPLNTKTHINTMYNCPFMSLVRIIAHLKLYLHVGYVPKESHDTCLKTLSFGDDCRVHKSFILLLCAPFWDWFHLSFIAIESQWKNENLFFIKPHLSGLVIFFHIGLMHILSLIMHIHVIQANWIPTTYSSIYEFPSIL